MPTDLLQTDILLFGGGITGLWTLNRLVQAGYSAVLFESVGLGGVQTLASQGIIHGGTKYALSGALSESARAIGAMPGRWRACLSGSGELDLRAARVSTENQFLWSTEGIASKLAGFFAGKLMQSRMLPVEPSEGPELFRTKEFKGTLYRLDEPVLDVPSLVEALSGAIRDRCYQLPETGWEPLSRSFGVRLAGGSELSARAVILCAGAGNALLLQRFGRSSPRMQRRPLHMLMTRGRLPALHGHCLGASANPRLTVTTHRDHAGRDVWYIGGGPAEEGVNKEAEELIDAGRHELKAVLPWMDLNGLEWSSYRVDRAEPEQPGHRRPDSSFLEEREGIMTLWPTKLAFAPYLADQVLLQLRNRGVAPSGGEKPSIPLPLPLAQRAEPPWEGAHWWS